MISAISSLSVEDSGLLFLNLRGTGKQFGVSLNRGKWQDVEIAPKISAPRHELEPLEIMETQAPSYATQFPVLIRKRNDGIKSFINKSNVCQPLTGILRFRSTPPNVGKSIIEHLENTSWLCYFLAISELLLCLPSKMLVSIVMAAIGVSLIRSEQTENPEGFEITEVGFFLLQVHRLKNMERNEPLSLEASKHSLWGVSC